MPRIVSPLTRSAVETPNRGRRKNKGMDRQPNRLIEQLQNIQVRQRKVIQQLQAENARLLSDIADVRQERDVYQGKAALARRENVELQNRLEEVLTEYQDLKRGRATVVRFVTSVTDTRRRSVNPSSKTLNTLSVVNEEQTKSPPTTESTTTSMGSGKAARPKLRPACLLKEFPNPPKLQSDHTASTFASKPAMIQEVFR